MIDTNILVRTWLAADTALLSLLGRDEAGDPYLFAGQLPKDFNPGNGIAVTLKVAGGTSDHETPIVRPRVQVTVWADVDRYQDAREVYREVHDWLHAKNMVDFGDLGTVLSSVEESHGQDITDPDTAWATVVVFFNMVII